MPERPRVPTQRKKQPPPDPVIVAERMAALHRGNRELHERKRAMRIVANDAAQLAQMPLAEVRQYLTRKELAVAMLWLGHYTQEDIAATEGYWSRKAVWKILKRPAVARFVEAVEAAQLEKAISGEFGVRQQAKAAAPRVLKQVITKAGGLHDSTGNPVGMAEKDSDAIRAADLVLTVAGDKESKQTVEHLHKHLHLAFAAMTPEELRRLGETGEFPARYAALAEKLQDAPQTPAIRSDGE